MTDKPVYRWEIRRAARQRRVNQGDAISMQDWVMMILVAAMMVIVLRILIIFGVVLGMQIGPFVPFETLLSHKDLPYAGNGEIMESFRELKYISSALLLYWILSSGRSLVSKSNTATTKLFRLTIGTTILILVVTSFFPENAMFLAENWFPREFSPQHTG